MENSTVDLAAIKIGDEVAWLSYSRGSAGQAWYGKIARLTPTQIVVTTLLGIAHRFHRESGHKLGDRYVYLLDRNDPRVLRSAALARAERAIHEITEHIRKTRITEVHEALAMLAAISSLAEVAAHHIRAKTQENGS